MKAENTTLLLVEDDPNDVVLVQRALRRAGLALQVRSAGSVAQARAYLTGELPYADRAANPIPSMILLDLKMPGGSGIDLLTWMRARADTRRIPVIILSSSKEQGDVDRAYDAGCNSYLVKPVAFDALQEMFVAFGRYWLEFNTAPELQRISRSTVQPS
ncbi:MAG: response regulator [Planctomycetes bacterium]|nr:response regulator [Planctomycetota bacterium]